MILKRNSHILRPELASFGPAIMGLLLVMGFLSACVTSPSEGSTSHPPPTNAVPISIEIEVVEHNLEWIPQTEQFSGVKMALVPPGCFMMGATEDQVDYLMSFPGSNMELENYQDQFPAHKICFDEPFWIDVYEVTQAQFIAFQGEADNDSLFSGGNLPREKITWIEANNFCQQRGVRLPTEAEWEYAARGPDGLLFPWGDIFDCQSGNFDDTTMDDEFLIEGAPDCDGFPASAPVGSLETGKSWVGALDLSGNVWEWVADYYQSQYYNSLQPGTINPPGPASGHYRVVRGGAWSINEVDHLSASFRAGIDPLTASEHLGFRCAKSFE